MLSVIFNDEVTKLDNPIELLDYKGKYFTHSISNMNNCGFVGNFTFEEAMQYLARFPDDVYSNKVIIVTPVGCRGIAAGPDVKIEMIN